MKARAQNDPNSSETVDISVGVITNSDGDRVLSVLSSLGILIGPPRRSRIPHNLHTGVRLASGKIIIPDIDFVAFSYDIGFEKPSREIFDAAKELAGPDTVQGARGQYLHIGDDFDKDFKGAQQAGWGALLLDREKKHTGPESQESSISSLLEIEPRISSILSKH